MKIFKYILPPNNKDSLALPKRAIILHIQMSDNNICLWAFVNDKQSETVRVDFKVVMTGEEIAEYPIYSNGNILEYFKTIQAEPHVWHIFLQKNIVDSGITWVNR